MWSDGPEPAKIEEWTRFESVSAFKDKVATVWEGAALCTS